jgi:hypothetical protein
MQASLPSFVNLEREPGIDLKSAVGMGGMPFIAM